MLCLLVLTSVDYSTRLTRKPISAPTVLLASTKASPNYHISYQSLASTKAAPAYISSQHVTRATNKAANVNRLSRSPNWYTCYIARLLQVCTCKCTYGDAESIVQVSGTCAPWLRLVPPAGVVQAWYTHRSHRADLYRLGITMPPSESEEWVVGYLTQGPVSQGTCLKCSYLVCTY